MRARELAAASVAGAITLFSWAAHAADASSAVAQAAPSYANLRVLGPDADVPGSMAMMSAALGVGCDFCHVADNPASDANAHKVKARTMLAMTRDIASRFPDSGGDFQKSRYLPYPGGKQYVTCHTCHRGERLPPSQAPAEVDRAPEPKDSKDFGKAMNPPPPRPAAAPAAARAPARPPRNLHYLPQDTDFFEVMEGMRMSLGVECNYCHVYGDRLEHGHANDFETGEGRWDDGNPKKLIAREMIRLVRDANNALGVTGFPLTKLVAGDIANGNGVVTCYTCHRGNYVPGPPTYLP